MPSRERWFGDEPAGARALLTLVRITGPAGSTVSAFQVLTLLAPARTMCDPSSQKAIESIGSECSMNRGG